MRKEKLRLIKGAVFCDGTRLVEKEDTTEVFYSTPLPNLKAPYTIVLGNGTIKMFTCGFIPYIIGWHKDAPQIIQLFSDEERREMMKNKLDAYVKQGVYISQLHSENKAYWKYIRTKNTLEIFALIGRTQTRYVQWYGKVAWIWEGFPSHNLDHISDRKWNKLMTPISDQILQTQLELAAKTQGLIQGVPLTQEENLNLDNPKLPIALA